MKPDRIPGPQAPGRRPQPLRGMFSAIPRRYDLLNRLLTGGFDMIWRRRAARECLRAAPGYMLDLCCGTGDLALEVVKMSRGEPRVVGLDFAGPMLEEAGRKASAAGLDRPMGLIEGDAADLPFADGRFSVVGISFAFRNLTYRNPVRSRYLSEVLRVLSPGGRFVIVETSQPRNPVLRAAAHMYYRLAVSPVGGLVSGRVGAYRYLATSARLFSDAGEVSRVLLDAGFAKVDVYLLFGGVAAIHVAYKQPERLAPGPDWPSPNP